jgi:hypothetical protein
LNICHEHSGVTAPLRRQLWELHTGGKGAQEDVAAAFKEWGTIISKNAQNKNKKLAPDTSLVGFMYTGTKLTYKD